MITLHTHVVNPLYFLIVFLKLEHSSIYSRKESWYKAFKAGGGESSIQNTSSEIFLTCCARAWATWLPLLLIQLKSTQCIPKTKWRTSSTTLLNKDRLAKDEDNASHYVTTISFDHKLWKTSISGELHCLFAC